jgi:hypothetical protein
MAGQIGLLESWQRFRYDGEINTFVIAYSRTPTLYLMVISFYDRSELL